MEMTEPLYDSSSYVICIHFKSPPICPELERPCLGFFEYSLSIVVTPWIIRSIVLSIVRGTGLRWSILLSIF